MYALITVSLTSETTTTLCHPACRPGLVITACPASAAASFAVPPLSSALAAGQRGRDRAGGHQRAGDAGRGAHPAGALRPQRGGAAPRCSWPPGHPQPVPRGARAKALDLSRELNSNTFCMVMVVWITTDRLMLHADYQDAK